MFLIVVALLMGFCVAQLSSACGMWALIMQFDRPYVFLLNEKSLHVCVSDY